MIANETVAGRALEEEILYRARGYDAEVLVVAPALNTPLRTLTSDVDGAMRDARERLNQSLGVLLAAGIDARGEIGDGNPLQAIEDALRTFGADEIIMSTHPPGRSNWLERDVVAKARERFPIEITHVIVDLEREASPLGGCRREELAARALDDVVGDGLDLLVVRLLAEGGHAVAAVRYAIRRELRRRLRLVEVRPDRARGARGGQRMAVDAARLREDLRPLGGRDLASARRGTLRVGRIPCALSHEVGDVVGVLTRNEVGRHGGIECRERDLRTHDLLERALREALLARGGEAGVEVRARRPDRLRAGRFHAYGSFRRPAEMNRSRP